MSPNSFRVHINVPQMSSEPIVKSFEKRQDGPYEEQPVNRAGVVPARYDYSNQALINTTMDNNTVVLFGIS